MTKYFSQFFAVLVVVISSGSSTVAADFEQCFSDIRSGKYGPNGGVDNRGNPVQNISLAVGMTYDLCISACGSDATPFSWSDFSQKFSAWLLPWLALISQLPFGASLRVDNLTSVILAVGSPTLAAYSLTLTVLNGEWVARHFRGISYPNVDHAFRIMSSLQQAPLKITHENSLLSSLIVLPENDKWWRDLADRLDYTHTWSISASTSIAWVALAYIFTVVDSFTRLTDQPTAAWSDGEAVGTGWLWLAPIVIGWLQISPKCDSERLKNAIARANDNASVMTLNGISEASRISEMRAFALHNREDAIYDDEDCSAPIYNYARFLPWTYHVHKIVSAFRSAADRAQNHAPVDKRRDWEIDEHEIHKVHPNNRKGSMEQVKEYCTPVTYSRWGTNTLNRFLLACFAALLLQWGTTGAAVIILWFTPTRGLGCRSASYLVYAATSTLIWMILVTSSSLTYYASSRHRRLSSSGQQGPLDSCSMPRVIRVTRTLAITLRRLGKLLAAWNTVWILLASTMQFGNFYSRCYCDSCVTSLGRHAYNIILITTADVKGPWIGGVTLGCGCVVFFVGFINMFISPTL